jgi:hypothetical protein
MDFVWSLDLKFLRELAATMAGASNPPHQIDFNGARALPAT